MSLSLLDKTDMYQMMAEFMKLYLVGKLSEIVFYSMDVIWRNLFSGMAKLLLFTIIIIYCTASFQDAIEAMLILKQTLVYIGVY